MKIIAFYLPQFHEIPENWLLLLPVMIYLLQSGLDGGRTNLLRLCIQILISILYADMMYHNTSKPGAKLFIIISITGCLFFAVYEIYGLIRHSMFTSVYHLLSYPGSSIQALNVYLENYIRSDVFGKETLITIRHMLSKIGFTVQSFPLPLEYVSWTNGSTNIYTALRRYIADYSVCGALGITGLLGFMYGLFEKVIQNTKILWCVVLYADLLYPVIEFLFEERFLIGLCSAGTVYDIIFIFLLQFTVKITR